jgi:hypothetical protein
MAGKTYSVKLTASSVLKGKVMLGTSYASVTVFVRTGNVVAMIAGKHHYSFVSLALIV